MKIIRNTMGLVTGSWVGKELGVSIMRGMTSEGLICSMKVMVNNNTSLTFAQSHSVGSRVKFILLIFVL